MVSLALRQGDDGDKYNRVRAFEVVGVDAPERDPLGKAILRVQGRVEAEQIDCLLREGRWRCLPTRS